MIRLSRDAIAVKAGVETPLYDMAAVRPGIVHLGLGGFHRAHLARYTHDLMNLDAHALEWGIAGVGLRSQDRHLIEALQRQDGLYTLVEQEGARQRAVVIGAIRKAILAAESASGMLAEMGRREIRIVSLTVTEHGYHLDRPTRRLDLDHEDVRHDLACPGEPRTPIGAIAEALSRRRQAGLAGFTVLSCDNIQNNGDVVKAALLAFSSARDPGLAEWIEAHAAFPNSMVDRITPVPQPAQIAAFRAAFDLDDAAPIFTETFRQWVIEDRFIDGRPTWERVGAQFVEDVAPYELMKLRLLNCSHLAIAGLGQLAGYVLVSEAMSDPLIAGYMRALMDQETAPTLRPVPGVDLDDYKRTLTRRFANTAIEDTVQRVNTDAPLTVILDSLRDRLRVGGSIRLLALALAAWLRRVRGEDEQGRSLSIVHPLASLLRDKAIQGGADPAPLLGIGALFGDLGSDPRLREEVGTWLRALYEKGTRETMRAAAQRGYFQPLDLADI